MAWHILSFFMDVCSICNFLPKESSFVTIKNLLWSISCNQSIQLFHTLLCTFFITTHCIILVEYMANLESFSKPELTGTCDEFLCEFATSTFLQGVKKYFVFFWQLSSIHTLNTFFLLCYHDGFYWSCTLNYIFNHVLVLGNGWYNKVWQMQITWVRSYLSTTLILFYHF